MKCMLRSDTFLIGLGEEAAAAQGLAQVVVHSLAVVADDMCGPVVVTLGALAGRVVMGDRVVILYELLAQVIRAVFIAVNDEWKLFLGLEVGEFAGYTDGEAAHNHNTLGKF